MSERILILDDMDSRHVKFVSLHFGAKFFCTRTADEAIKALENETFNLIYLDHDLADEHYEHITELDYADSYTDYIEKKEKLYKEKTGHAVAEWLAKHPDRSPNAKIVVHSCNSEGSMRMVQTLQAAGRKAKYVPFTEFNAKYYRLR